MKRCCSFCRLPGHTISNCVDQRLYDFEIIFLSFIAYLYHDLTLIYPAKIRIIKNFLLERALENPNLIKAFAIKKCGVNTRKSIDVYIDYIIRFYTFDLNKKIIIQVSILENSELKDESCECGICYESNKKNKFIKLDCGHEFCKDCIKKTLQNETKTYINCAFCRSEIKSLELRNSSVRDELNMYIRS